LDENKKMYETLALALQNNQMPNSNDKKEEGMMEANKSLSMTVSKLECRN
jgi:hypothetical protein